MEIHKPKPWHGWREFLKGRNEADYIKQQNGQNGEQR